MIPVAKIAALRGSEEERLLLDLATKMAKQLNARALFWVPEAGGDVEIVVPERGRAVMHIPVDGGEIKLKLDRPVLILTFGKTDDVGVKSW